MAKKNKKGKSSEDVHTRKQSIKKTINPFEVHINKEKMKVLGKKTKNSKGLPGVSRAKGIQKRKDTLLQEYKSRNKNNYFKDKRLGERNNQMSEEARLEARFAAVKKKSLRKSIFNLADDVLTHGGKNTSEIDEFHVRSDDEESIDGDNGRLDSDFVESAHFAGGVFTKTNNDGTKTHKEVIDELIADSKRRKAEKQQKKEVTVKLTEQLDSEWRDLMPLIKNIDTKKAEADKPKVSDYDKIARQLRFEAKGKATDRLKSEDEIAKEEKEKLEELENERLKRMRGILDSTPSKPTHRSADDLDDDFHYESDLDEEMLTYNEQGETNIKISAQLNGKEINLNEKTEDENKHHEVSDEESDDNNDDESNNDNSSQSEESESEDDLSDLKGIESDDDDDEYAAQENAKANVNEVKSVKRKANDFHTKEEVKKTKTLDKDASAEKSEEDLKLKTEAMEKAMRELPYTFTIPSSYEELENTLENHSTEEVGVIIARMIKCNHPSLSEGNKQKLGKLFALILQYVNDIAINAVNSESINMCFKKFSELSPYLFELSQFDKANAHNCMREVIKEKHEEYRKKVKLYPGLETLMFLKLVSLLFPTSDFRHQVVTPCFVYIDQMLTKCKVNNKREISYCIFLTTLALEYTTLSNRLIPAAITALNGLIHMAIPKFPIKIIKVLPPFRAMSSNLVLSSKQISNSDSFKMVASDLLQTEIDDNYKVRVIYTTVKLLDDFHERYKELPSNVEIFEKTLNYLELLPQQNYPDEIKEAISSLITNLKRSKSERKLQYVAGEVKRPKALRLFEPKIEEVYEGKKHKVQSKKKAEAAKLLHKYKNERKGALREIRKDQAFLSRIKMKEATQRDKERQEKVKKLYAEASIQQSGLNAMDRAKKSKK